MAYLAQIATLPEITNAQYLKFAETLHRHALPPFDPGVDTSLQASLVLFEILERISVNLERLANAQEAANAQV